IPLLLFINRDKEVFMNIDQSSIESSREKVQSTETSPTRSVQTCSYPSTIANNPAHSNYLVFHIVEAMTDGDLSASTLQTKRSNFLKSPASTKSIGMIQMYMPAMMENLDHTYSDSQSGMMDDLIGTFAKSPGDLSDKLMNTAKEAGPIIAEHAEQKAANRPTVVRQFGQIQGQRQSLLYGGTQLRSQTFFFTLRARNLVELKNIGQIIYMFRRYSSGSTTSNVINFSNRGDETYGTVKVPPAWFIEERTKGPLRPRSIDKFAMGPASITSVKVNKTPDQLYQTIQGTPGDPVSVELEVTFKEMVPTYSDFWDDLRGVTTSAPSGEPDSVGKYARDAYGKAKQFVQDIF
ncbi:MAG: baseplate tail-tube junction protein, partial [Bacilli bacterium]